MNSRSIPHHFSYFLLLTIVLITPIIGSITAIDTINSIKCNELTYTKKSSNEIEFITIFFDVNDPTTLKSAFRMKNTLQPYFSNLKLVEITSLEELSKSIGDHSWMNLYFFHGSENGINVKGRTIPWLNIGVLLQNSPASYHLFESCYSSVLEESNSNLNIHGMDNRIDAELAYLDSLVYLADIFQEREFISNTLKTIVANRFLTNLPEIIFRALAPVEPMDSSDTLSINLTSDDSLVRGPWGWLTRLLLSGWLDKSGMGGDIDWYTVSQLLGTTLIDVNKTQVATGGIEATKEIKKSNLGSGKDTSTGYYAFDIPLNLGIKPSVGTGPWYQPEYVDLNMEITTAQLDLAKATGLDKIMKAAGYNVKLTLDPSLWGGIRVGDYVPELASKNPFVQSNPVAFLGGGFTIKLHFEIGIPLATFLDYIIPGSGKAVASILNALQIRVDLLNEMDLLVGIGYNATAQSSVENVLLKVGMGFLIDAKFPSAKQLVKKAIGLDIPGGLFELGMKLRGTAGIAAMAQFGPDGDGFKVGLYYSMMFKFWARIFWFLKFGWEDSWKDTIWLIEAVTDPATPKTDEHANLDLDSDGLWDSIEPSLGLNNQSQDTDNDGLSDGMELNEYYTDPLKYDSDGDGMKDSTEVAEFYKLNLNPLADYDNDGLHCLLDVDSDNDGLNDSQEIYGLPFDAAYNRFTKTNPSLPDTDWDGLTDSEEFMWTDSMREFNHTDPTTADTDGDSIKDGAEHYYFLDNPEGHPWEPSPLMPMDTIDYLLDPDSDNDLLNDGLEKILRTDPLDIDSDNDYDLNDNNIIESGELLSGSGNLTDYGEFVGNFWPGGPFDPDGACNEPWPIPTNPLSKDSDGDGDS